MRSRSPALLRRRALPPGGAILLLALGGCSSAPPAAPAAPAASGTTFAFRDPGFSLPAGPLPRRDGREIARAMEAVRKGDAVQARERFSFGAAAAKNPLPFRLGVAYADLLAGRYDPAREALERLVREAPGYVPAAEALADLDAAEGREREALDRYRTLLKILPADPRLAAREESVRDSLVGKLEAAAESALAARDLAGARRDALSVLEVAPSSPAAYRLLARAAEAEGRPADAWSAAAKAVALDPADQEWSRKAADLAMQSGHYAEAVALYDDLAKRDPSLEEALEEAQYQFQVQTLPEVPRRAALSTKVTRAQFAVLAWWLVPEVRDARVPAAPDLAVDAIERPESQALVRAIALGFFAVAPGTHRVGADQPLTRSEAAALLRRVGRLAAGTGPVPDCLAEGRPPAASPESCGILSESTSRTVTGPEVVRGLMAAARTGRGGNER